MIVPSKTCNIMPSNYIKNLHGGVNIVSNGLRLGDLMSKNNILKDEKGGPLVEESLLLGIAVVTVSIVIAVILQATGWVQDLISSLMQILHDSWSSFSNIFTP